MSQIPKKRSAHPEKRKRTPALNARESEFSTLALVRSAGDRGLDQDTAWDPEPDDAELLASLATAHPWIEQVARELQVLSDPKRPKDLTRLRQVPRHGYAERVNTLIEFAIWLADPGGANFSGPPLVRTFIAATQALATLDQFAAEHGPLRPEALIRILREVDDLPLSAGVSLTTIGHAIRRLAQFLKLDKAVLELLSPDERDELESGDHETSADACVLSIEEYLEVLRALDTGLYPALTKGDRSLGRLLLTICFRLGLRPGEVYGLRLRDVTSAAIYVLPYAAHTLKSNNARRRVPLNALMPSDENERLQSFVQNRLARGAQPDDLLLAQPTTGPVNRQRLDRWVHRVMRDVTMDPRIRLYHARHSLSTWADLALRASDHPELLNFFDELPRTRDFLSQGDQLARALFGSRHSALGRSSFALARLVGHVGPTVTHMHYIHGDDLVRAAVVERENRRIDKTVWMRLTGLARSTSFALLKDGSFKGLMGHARRSAGWHTKPVSLAGSGINGDGDVSAESSVVAKTLEPAVAEQPDNNVRTADTSAVRVLTDWIPVVRVCEISEAVALKGRSHEWAAAHFGLELPIVTAMMASLKQWLPEVAQPGKRATEQAATGLASLALSSSTAGSIQRAEAAARQQAQRDPVGLRSDLAFLIKCYDRRDRDFHVKDAEDLRRLAQISLALGIQPANTVLMARTAGTPNEDPRLPSWVRAQDLGAFEKCQVRSVRVRSAAKAASYARWLGLMPVTSAQEGCGSSYALLAALVMAVLDANARSFVNDQEQAKE